MKIPTEKHIERFVLKRSELSEKEQKWIQKWIQKDEEIRLIAEWFQTFYQKLERVENVKERPENFPSTIKLVPKPQKSNYSKGAFVLAAQTVAAANRKNNLETIRTFVSEEHKTLIRFLHNSSKNRTKLHVISEFLQDDDVVLIDIEDHEYNTLVSKPGGTFEIPDQKISEETIKNWQKCELHLPISKIKVFKNELMDTLNYDTREARFEREELNIERKNNDLDITFFSTNKNKIIPDKMVVRTGEKSSLWPIKNGRCSIPVQYLSDSVSILFFYK